VLASGIYQDAVGYVLNLKAAGLTDEHLLVDLLLIPQIQQKLVLTEDKAYLIKTLFARPASLPKYIPHPIPHHLLKKGKWKEIDFNSDSSMDEDTVMMSVMPGSEMKLLELGHVQVTKNGYIIWKFNLGKLSSLTKDGKDVFLSSRELRWFYPDVKTLFNVDLPLLITASHGRPVIFRESNWVGMFGGPAEMPLMYGGTLLSLHGKGI
jgi:hypothetical protein